MARSAAPWARSPGLRLLLVAAFLPLPHSSQFSCVIGRRCEDLGPLPAPTGMVLSPGGFLRVQRRCSDALRDGEGEPMSSEGRSLDGLAELNVSADGSNLTFGFSGYLDLASTLDSYDLCWCQPNPSVGENCSTNSGFQTWLGNLKVTGPREVFYTCATGRACSLDVTGVGLRAGDRITPMSECGDDFLADLPGLGFLETQDGSAFEFVQSQAQIAGNAPFDPRVQAHAGTYQLCFCRPLPSRAGSCSRGGDFRAGSGFLVIGGPYPAQSFSCLLGQACQLDAYQGVSLKSGDRLMLLLTCQTGLRGSLGPARFETSGDGDSYNLGSWPVETTQVGEYELCWCPQGETCESPPDFAGLGGTLELLCPPKYFLNGTHCTLCDAYAYCPGGENQMRMICPSGSATNIQGAEDASQCLCEPGYYAARGNGTAQLQCSYCPWGTFAFGRGLTECSNSTFTCVVGQSCGELGPVTATDAGPGSELRAMKRCGVEDRVSLLTVASSSPVGNATLDIRTAGVFFDFGDGPVSAEPFTSYSLCWCDSTTDEERCRDNTRFIMELGNLRVEGPSYGEWVCTLGRDCPLSPAQGVGLRTGDRALVSYRCGTADPLPTGMPGTGLASYDGSGFYFNPLQGESDVGFLSAEPGIYRVCFCRPDNRKTCDSPGDFHWQMGYLTAEGPNVGQSGFECELGSPCAVSGLKGVNLTPEDQVKLMKTCGVDACASDQACDTFLPGSNPSDYSLGSLSTSLAPGTWKFCWCSGSYNCDAAGDFNIEAAIVSFSCETGYVIVQGECRSCCEDCFMVRNTITGVGTARSCELNHVHLMYFLLLLVAFPLLALTLLYFPAVPLQDVERDEEATVVTTAHGHLVLSWARVPARFRGTCVPWLDSGKERYVVTVIDGNHLRLCRAGGEDEDRPCDTNRGELRIPFLYAGIFCGVLWVPFALWGALLLAISVICIVAGDLDASEVLTIAAVSVLGACLFHFFRWRLGCRTQIVETCKAYRKRLRVQNPKPQAGPRGATRALKVEKLLDMYEFFQAFIRGRNMYYICPNIVMPLTKKEQLSFAELAGSTVVDWFISHFWGMPFKHFVASVHKHAKSVANVDWKRVSYWVCTFSNNQWKVADEVGRGDWKESSFYKALRSGVCQGTAMVLDDQAKPLTRSWCLFEVLQTALLAEDDKSFAGLLLCTSSGVLNYGTASMDVATALARRLSSLRLQDASASCLEDKQMIDSLVDSMPGGFVTMNDFVRDGIRKCLVTMKDHFDGELSQLCAVLEDSTERLQSRQQDDSDDDGPTPRKRTEGPLLSKESTAVTAVETEHFPPHVALDVSGKPQDEVSLPGAAP